MKSSRRKLEGDEGSEVRIITFARTFEQKAHAESFRTGHLRLQTVEHFRGLEDSKKALRGDAYEGTSAIWQPKHLGHIVIGSYTLLPSELTAPVRLQNVAVGSWHVFCMHTIGITPEDPTNFEGPEDYKKSVMLDERCAGIGDHLVLITDKNAFLTRLIKAIRSLNYGFRGTTVRYFSELEFSGNFPEDEVPFYKPRRFAYQKEYRIVVQTPPGLTSPLLVEMGDISDISILSTFGEFASSFKLKLPDGRMI